MRFLLLLLMISLVSIATPQNKNNTAHKHFNNVLQEIKAGQISNVQSGREWNKEYFLKQSHKKNKLQKELNTVIYRPAKVITNNIENSLFASKLTTYTYDNSGNCLTLLSELISNGLKMNDARVSYTYDNSGNCITELQEGWDDSTWLNLVKYTYTYDNSGNFLTQMEEDWNDSMKVWVNGSKVTRTYDNSGKWILEVGYLWLESTNDWEIYSKYTPGYDNSGNLISQIAQINYGGTMMNLLRERSTYDNSGNRLTWYFDFWRNSKWNEYGRTTYTYNSSNQWLSMHTEIYVDSTGVWLNKTRSSAEYNSAGSLEKDITEEWFGNTWENLYKLEYSYDENNNAIHGESFAWKDSSWEYEWGDLDLFYDNNNRTVYSFAVAVDVEYIAIQPTDVNEEKANIVSFALEQNYPNPFNPYTVIGFQIPASLNPSLGGTLIPVTLRVYDLLGKEVAILVNEQKQPGYYKFKFDGSNLSSGIYFYRIDAGEFTSTKKLILMK